MKKMISVTIDEDLLKKSKDINLSGTINNLLRKYIFKKSNLPENNLKVICTQCSKEITEGYICENSDKIFCRECQDNWDYKTCVHVEGEHKHIKFENGTSKN